MIYSASNLKNIQKQLTPIWLAFFVLLLWGCKDDNAIKQKSASHARNAQFEHELNYAKYFYNSFTDTSRTPKARKNFHIEFCQSFGKLHAWQANFAVDTNLLQRASNLAQEYKELMRTNGELFKTVLDFDGAIDELSSIQSFLPDINQQQKTKTSGKEEF